MCIFGIVLRSVVSILFVVHVYMLQQESCAVAKMTAQCALYGGLVNVPAKFEVRSFTCS